MNRFVKNTLTTLTASVILAGCGAAPEPEAPPQPAPSAPPDAVAPVEPEVPQTDAGVTGADVKREVSEAVSAVSQYASQAKDEYLKKLESQLGDFNLQLEDLKQRATETGADMKVKFEEQQVVLKQKIDEAAQKIEEFRQSDQWESMKGMLDEAMADVREAFTIESSTEEITAPAESSPEAPAEP